jgi:flagellar hook-associated protein 2
MPITVDGITTGIDTSALIDAILVGYTVPQDSLRTKVSDLEQKQEHFSALSGLLSDLQTALDGMDTTKELSTTVASTHTGFTASLSDGAEVGAYDITVEALAKASVWTGPSAASATDAGAATHGTYTITVGGVATDITVDGTNDDLTSLTEALNDIDGVTAYVVQSGGQYQLVVRGADSGTDNAVDISTPSGAGFTSVQTATDSSVVVDGVRITGSSNRLDDVLPGVALDLTAVTTSAESLNVSMDTDTTVAGFESFVEAYNTIVAKISAQSAYDSEADIRGAFVGESSVRRISRTLRDAVSGTLANSGSFTKLSDIGITTDSTTGKLEIDTDLLKEALQSDRASVEALFTGTSGFAAKVSTVIDVMVDPLDGSLTARVDSMDDKIEEMNEQIDAYDDRISSYEARLRSQFEAMEVSVGRLQSLQTFLTAYFDTSSDS